MTSTRCGSVTSNFYMAVRGSLKSVRQMEPWEIFRNGRLGDVRVTALSLVSSLSLCCVLAAISSDNEGNIIIGVRLGANRHILLDQQNKAQGCLSLRDTLPNSTFPSEF